MHTPAVGISRCIPLREYGATPIRRRPSGHMVRRILRGTALVGFLIVAVYLAIPSFATSRSHVEMQILKTMLVVLGSALTISGLMRYQRQITG